uniref:Protein kinase domain-containing protein n=1 Tax=Meloidogyne javanica TaxID=6303 RepID=A0A915MJ94_MELJA
MTIVLRGGESGSIGGGQQPLSNSSTQRANRSSGVGSRFNGNRYRRTANSTIAGTGSSSSSIGGHPLIGADPQKKEIKHRFEITAKLGSGTYGKVSLAFDHKTEREVAVKLIKKSAIENKQDLVRIRREIRIMSMLNHPNLIQIYEVFENKDKIILVMEYASGGELYDYVSKNGSLSEQEARRIFRQITSAVLYCHKNKVAHRDLKLENILLDSNNNAKIADFGLSNYFGQRNKLLSTFCGSPLYASPEIINGTPYKGPEVDCWSLGILLYTLVYGSMPFDGRDFNRMVRQIKRGAYYEPDTPSTASMLIRNMLRVNPDRRATIYDISGHWWLNLEENMPVIQELPENQITDPTPLTERAEIMVVQELADETDVLEQMEKGPVSLNLIANIRAHPFYDERPEVKELLETIIAAQPVEIQRKASKITKQKSKDVENNLEEKEIKKVGFSTDSSTEEIGQQQNDNSTPNTPKATIPPPPPPQMSAPKFVGTARISRSEPLGGIDDEEYLEDEDEFYDAAEEEEDEFEVATVKPSIPPKIVEKSVLPEPGPSTSKTTDSLERGLAKRVSKGKYQYSDSVELPNQDKKEQFKRNKVWMKSHDPDAESLSAENSNSLHKNNRVNQVLQDIKIARALANYQMEVVMTYLDRRKSFHEMSPPNDDTPYDRYAIAGGYFNSLVGNSYMPSNISKYEEEVYNAFNKQYGGGTSTRAATNNIWPSQQQHQQQQNYYGGIAKERPERFEVYKTMAERASEFGRNDLNQYQHRMSAGGSCYYPGERPLSSYAGGSIGLRSGPRTEEYGGGMGGGGGIRRSIYETERPITPCNEYISGNYYSHNQPLPEPESPPRGGEGRFRRKIAALRDADGRRSSYASRSQSNDHMALLSRGAYMPDELEQIEPISGNSRYATPEIGGGVGGGYSNQLPEYAYIAYHDSGMPGGGQQYINSRSSRRDQHNNNVDLDATPIRGILKNRQAYEGEPRVQGRLRRHQSVDKGYLNSHSLDEHQNYNNQEFSRIGSSYSRRYGANREYDYDVNLNNKKRGSAGLLNSGRRKTTEVRLGPESVPNSRKQSANM